MFVEGPPMRNSSRAREARLTLAAKSSEGEWAITFASRESNAGFGS